MSKLCPKCGGPLRNVLPTRKGGYLGKKGTVYKCTRCPFFRDEGPKIKIDLNKPTKEEIETAKRMRGVRRPSWRKIN